MSNAPFIVGIGGTTGEGSATESALRVALGSAERHGARTRLFGGAALQALPHYVRGEENVAAELIEAVRAADGLILASPGYHGSISGLVKNAVDYLEATSRDARVYLDGLPVGLIVTAYGWQATGSTLATLRSIVHALRGWPTPLGAAIKSEAGMFDGGTCLDAPAAAQLSLVGEQVVEFSRLRQRAPAITRTETPAG
ncbi:FMN reductase [Sphingomonas jejuensis]|uniref:FMN reductase n=1 Tax=Sphingomonas jejuensis TaxID=904715 RepID=A0ABX0XKA6_9SPHN|nr:NAD(P)H-dependent oxidoreductase [Sphingomonas jejuensis]NJC33776.1 FMN reductase [Sphingomonas jejuensis]